MKFEMESNLNLIEVKSEMTSPWIFRKVSKTERII